MLDDLIRLGWSFASCRSYLNSTSYLKVYHLTLNYVCLSIFVITSVFLHIILQLVNKKLHHHSLHS